LNWLEVSEFRSPWQQPENPPHSDAINPLLRLLTAAASHGLLTGQIIFSPAFVVGPCELSNWLHAPRQVNACLERWMTVSALFFTSDMQMAASSSQRALAPGRRVCSDELHRACWRLRRP
jgi:hypothetical protein